jgi:uncharacterized membrane protein YkvA (DUF1232 family)
MDDVKYGEILMPGDDETQKQQEESVRAKFWPTFRRAARQIPFARDVVAAFYCAVDSRTPTRVRGILLAALGYFVMPIDIIPDFFAVVGFSDDMAVLTLAFSMIRSHIRQEHYDAADRALADEKDAAKPAR